MFLGRVKHCSRCGKDCTKDKLYRIPGDEGSELVLLFPAPDIAQCMHGLYTNIPGKVLYHMLVRVTGIEPLVQALSIAIVSCAGKTTQVRAQHCHTHCASHIRSAKLCVIVGNDTYKALFNCGAAPEMLYGKSFRDPSWPCTFFMLSDYRKLEVFTQENMSPAGVFWQTKFCGELTALRACLQELSIWKGRR